MAEDHATLGWVRIEGTNLARAQPVTPNDSTPVDFTPTGIYVGTTGDVTIKTSGSNVTFKNLAAGVWHPMPPFTHVLNTGTTATDLIAGA